MLLEHLLITSFVRIDDFCQSIKDYPIRNLQLEDNNVKKKRLRLFCLSTSEICTIIVSFHGSGFRCFKWYYETLTSKREYRNLFPNLPSYNRFVELMQNALIPLLLYLNSCCRGKVTGISFIDSTKLAVCGNKRINSHKVFKNISATGKTTIGWFHGFKLHLVINDMGELLAFALTAGNIDDREPVKKITSNVFGKLFGDKGYVSQKLFEQLYEKGITFITGLKSNMKNKLINLKDKILLRKRSLIETINDQLKNISQVEHTRHRSPVGFFANLLGALISYAHAPKKPSLNLQNIPIR